MSSYSSSSIGNQRLDIRGSHFSITLLYRMIKTNEWTIADLIKYLVAVRNTLTSEEWSRLKLTSAFSKETSPGELSDGQKKPPRFQASQLYEPLPVFRDLGLPVIDWGTQHKWRATSEEGEMNINPITKHSSHLNSQISV